MCIVCAWSRSGSAETRVAWLTAAPVLASARLGALAAAGLLVAEASVVRLAAALDRSALAARRRARLLATSAAASVRWAAVAAAGLGAEARVPAARRRACVVVRSWSRRALTAAFALAMRGHFLCVGNAL